WMRDPVSVPEDHVRSSLEFSERRGYRGAGVKGSQSWNIRQRCICCLDARIDHLHTRQFQDADSRPNQKSIDWPNTDAAEEASAPPPAPRRTQGGEPQLDLLRFFFADVHLGKYRKASSSRAPPSMKQLLIY